MTSAEQIAGFLAWADPAHHVVGSSTPSPEWAREAGEPGGWSIDLGKAEALGVDLGELVENLTASGFVFHQAAGPDPIVPGHGIGVITVTRGG